jgi:solute carrier family 25 iron transporter 28/37
LDWEGSRPDEFPFIKHMFAGSMAGIMEHWGMFPFDTVKTHMQASKTKLGFVNSLRSLYKQHGFFGFYNGVRVIASGWIPAHACYFSTYEIAKEKFGIDDGNTHFVVSGLIGSLATLSHDAFLTPSDCIKQRMQLNRMSAFACIKKTISEEGFRALYRSYPITIMMNVPFAFAIVSANENIKVYAKPKDSKNPFFFYFAWAFAAGMLAAVITNPMDVVKTRLQIQHQWSCLDEYVDPETCKSPKASANETPVEQTEKLVEAKYTDFRDVARKIYKNEGIHGFYKGAVPRMMLVAPGVAISWGTYEMFKSLLIKDNSSH